MATNILRLHPLEFAHVLDLNLNVTYVETGPGTIMLQENHEVVFGPAKFIIVPAGSYCAILNPAKLPVAAGQQAELEFGHSVVKFHQDPFVLYPGEVLVGAKDTDYAGAIKKLPSIPVGNALKLEALIDFDDNGVKRVAGAEWQVEGPCTYYPRPEVKTKGKVESIVITFKQALHLKAKADMIDQEGNARVTGEEWLYRKCGSYLPGIHEEVIHLVDGYTLTLNNALHITAKKNLVDGIGKKRLAGENWLITETDASFYIPEVGEDVVNEIKRTVLANQQFCVVLNPYENGRQVFGKRELRKGECSFFLKPGEKLEAGVQNAYLLQDDEALILQAMEKHDDVMDGKAIVRTPGDIWMKRGPMVYIPPVEIKVKHVRKPIALAKNEGVYVQNEKTGVVKTVAGPQSYLLDEHEKLWNKELSEDVEIMLKNGGCYGDKDVTKLAFFEMAADSTKRDKTRVVTYRIPTSCAVQIFDHQKQTRRIVFGPNLVSLGPSEEFNVWSLSAGRPKKTNAIKCLVIMLEQSYLSDIIVVETADHARLKITYAANKKFEYTIGDEESERKLFSVPDYIGYATRNIGSRIRGTAAKTSFDEFHRHSTKIVTEAVFGICKVTGKLRDSLKFKENNMVITTIDLLSIEPVDTHMRDSLLKSVQLAIEISTQSIELAAKHDALRTEQTAKGNLDIYQLENEKAAETERKNLYSLRAVTAAVQSSGQAKAEAEAEAQKLLIEGKSAIDVAKLKMEAEEIEEERKLATLQSEREAEIVYTKVVSELEVDKAKRLAQIETDKTAKLIESIGRNTIQNIALAGPAAQIHMLQGLGIRSTLITDGKTPVNLYQAGNGMIRPMIQEY